MGANTIRTTINLHPGMLERVKMVTRDEQISVSQFIEQSLEKMLHSIEKQRLNRMYQGLFALKGQGKSHVTDASTTIDETLYSGDGTERPNEL